MYGPNNYDNLIDPSDVARKMSNSCLSKTDYNLSID